MPFPALGAPELLIIMVIVLIVFGAGKFTSLGGALGKGIRDFRTEMSGGKDEPAPAAQSDTVVTKVDAPAAPLTCSACSTALASDARFCPKCGAAVAATATRV